LVNIERCAKDYIPRGSFTLLASDQVTFITDEAYAADIKKKLGHLMDDPYLDSSCFIDNTVEEIIEDPVENLIEKE
jgi:hypothetical protein